MGGTMRSGTSLTRAIVGSHSQVAIYPRDLPLWSSFYDKYEDKIIHDELVWKKIILDVVGHKKGGYQDAEFVEKAEGHFKVNNFSVPSFIAFFLNNYKEKLNKTIPGIKTPNSEVFADEIFNFFPNAKFIHLIRDPRNTEASRLRMTSFLGDEPGFHLKVWKRSVRLAFENQKKYPNDYLVIKYEDLIQNIENKTKEICDFLEIDFEESMLKFEGLEDWSGANSSFDSVKSGEINTDSLVRYKKYLPKYRRFLCIWKLGDELDKMGYEPDDLKLSGIEKLIFKLVFTFDFRHIKSILRKKTKTYRF